MDIYFHNTLTGSKDKFETLEHGSVKMYNCGPTLYDIQHIGNLSMFVFTDVLRRTLEYGGYRVNQVINFTDFGHLSGDNQGDADTGEDRMTKGLKREGLELSLENMKVLAEKYAGVFLEDLARLNVNTENTQFPYASQYITAQIDLIKKIEENGYTYKGSGGLYFDTSKFTEYGKLGNINLEGLKEGARVAGSEDKRNPTDFLLWKSAPNVGWFSPWGQGFPGWHIECSAMIIKLLGEQIDIHTGGIEHIPVHHNNEIAQSESATGKKPFSKFWLHRSHIKIDDAKISKSLGNTVYLNDLILRQIHPLSFRYLLLSSHYRTPANFSWEAVQGAQNALENIVSNYNKLPDSHDFDEELLQKFNSAISDDLNTPVAIALLQEAKSKKAIEMMDKVLGLAIKNLSKKITDIPEEIIQIKRERDEARANKEWAVSDDLRAELEVKGYRVNDTTSGTEVQKTLSLLTRFYD